MAFPLPLITGFLTAGFLAAAIAAKRSASAWRAAKACPAGDANHVARSCAAWALRLMMNCFQVQHDYLI